MIYLGNQPVGVDLEVGPLEYIGEVIVTEPSRYVDFQIPEQFQTNPKFLFLFELETNVEDWIYITFFDNVNMGYTVKAQIHYGIARLYFKNGIVSAQVGPGQSRNIETTQTSFPKIRFIAYSPTNKINSGKITVYREVTQNA